MIKPTDLSAIEQARVLGIDFSKDFYAQRVNVGGICADLAKMYGYRRPKNANGSRGRYYFMRLQRIVNKMAKENENNE
jgi:hypothetical protein